VSIPDVFVPACLTPGTTALIVVHNHPSGDPTPSADDARLTVRLCAAADVLDIALLDHTGRVAVAVQGLQLLRAEALRAGRTPTEVTLELRERLGIEARVLPMCDDPVRTIVHTESGAVSFPDYFVELKCEPAVRAFQYGGADEARLSDEVLDALHARDLEAVVLCPCNPYHTLQPILAVPGMREGLRKRGAPVIAVSPIVGGRALQGSAAKMMRELGREVSARAVAMEYRGLIDGIVIDSADEALAEGIRASGIQVLVTPTYMRAAEDRLRLARAVLEFARAVRLRREIAADA